MYNYMLVSCGSPSPLFCPQPKSSVQSSSAVSISVSVLFIGKYLHPEKAPKRCTIASEPFGSIYAFRASMAAWVWAMYSACTSAISPRPAIWQSTVKSAASNIVFQESSSLPAMSLLA